MRKKTSHREKDFGLVQRALCGDQDAFTTIFKKYNVILTIQIGEIINHIQERLAATIETAGLAGESVAFQTEALNNTVDVFKNISQRMLRRLPRVWGVSNRQKKIP